MAATKINIRSPQYLRTLIVLLFAVIGCYFIISSFADTSMVDKAKNQPASASTTEKSSLTADMANDGNSKTRWASAWGSRSQWWQVDLGSATPISKVDVKWERAYATHYLIQGSTDGVNFTTLSDVKIKKSGLKSNSFSQVSVRYLRIAALTRGTKWGYSIWDAKVYGLAATPAPSTPAPSQTPSPTPTPTPAPSTAPTPSPRSSSSITPTSRLYAANSFWNTPIPAGASLDTNSASIVSKAINPYKNSANLANSPDWGVPAVYSSASDKVYNVGCSLYDCNTNVASAIPRGAKPTIGSDHHLAVIDTLAATETDMWVASYNASADSWTANSRYQSSAIGSGALCAEGQHCNSANAAGFSLLGGVIFPWEIQKGSIDHALVLTSPYTRSGYIACPATHTDGRNADSAAIPMGARVRLNPAFDVTGTNWPAWQKIIARTLQTYGAYIGDTSGSLAIRGVAPVNALNPSWSTVGTPSDGTAYLNNLPWDQMQVLALKSCN